MRLSFPEVCKLALLKRLFSNKPTLKYVAVEFTRSIKSSQRLNKTKDAENEGIRLPWRKG